MTLAQLAIHTDRAVSCGTVLWRYCGRVQLTVVVKATFAIVHDGVATPAGPGEIVPEDRHVDGSPARSVAAASDLAPYLARCDVLFAGHAYALTGPATAGAVRLRMSRFGRWLLDKTIHVYGDRGPAGAPEPFSRMPIVYERAVGGPGAPNPAGTEAPNLADPADARQPAGFGPIARGWPARRLLLGGIDPQSIEGPMADIPEAMPGEYFQAAPRDQQIEPLRGGEWLVLEGLDPTLPRVQTRLPSARGEAHVVVHRPGDADTEYAVELACDTLAIDGDRRTFSLSWRGCCEVSEGEAALPSLVVLAGLGAPGVPVDWARVGATPAIEAPPPSAPPAPAPRGRPRAMTLQVGQLADLQSRAVLPFQPSGVSKTRNGESAPTEASAALPFTPSGQPARPPRTDATPWGTQGTPPASVAELGALPAKPAVMSFGLGMRLSSAPLSRTPMRSMPRPAEADDEDVETLVPGLAPAPPPMVVAPAMVIEPPPMMAAPAMVPEPPPMMAAPAPRSDPSPPVSAPSPSPDPWAPAPASPPPPPVSAPPASPDPWARAPASLPPPPPPPAPPKTFDRPSVAAVKGSFYSKFARK